MATKLTLGQTVHLDRQQDALGEIQIKLMWSELHISPDSDGLPVDLDLGCLYQLQDGTIGCIQALGDMYGGYQMAPFIELDRDDRTGGDDGETLRINGAHWRDIKKLCVFAYIYDGVTNWSSIETIAQLLIPGHAPVVIELENPRDDRGMCAITLIENHQNQVVVTKTSQYFETHKDLDEQYRFGLQWEIGAKRG